MISAAWGEYTQARFDAVSIVVSLTEFQMSKLLNATKGGTRLSKLTYILTYVSINCEYQNIWLIMLVEIFRKSFENLVLDY